MPAPVVRAVDPFDLPEWLAEGDVTWTATTSVHAGHLVTGELAGGPGVLPCDLLGVDQAFPVPVLGDDWRRQSHQAWTHGQVLLLEHDGRLTLAVPGTGFTADRALEALGRFAKAVGARPGSYLAAIRL
ncbi:MAG: hypothetical protein ACLGH4_01165 [Actinomycetes bacterium]